MLSVNHLQKPTERMVFPGGIRCSSSFLQCEVTFNSFSRSEHHGRTAGGRRRDSRCLVFFVLGVSPARYGAATIANAVRM
jgi:hypothetical protein